jgi:hypothetical protein
VTGCRRESTGCSDYVKEPSLPDHGHNSVHLACDGDDLILRFEDLDRYLRIEIHPCGDQPLCNQILSLMQGKAFDVYEAYQGKLDRSIQAHASGWLIVHASIEMDRKQIAVLQMDIASCRI